MHLPENVIFILSRLNSHGHRGDIVGGCVRDSLLGKTPNDYDITTDATPDELREIFADVRTVDTGIKHGTLTVIINSESYEVTTYRVDGEYTDNRHPDSVSFTWRLDEDLSRRDFTVNAMCYNPSDGLTDRFDGVGDLSRRIIRAVGDPERRFTEDALRILRALRFAATLDFAIERDTALAIRKTAHLMTRVSRERIYTEWKKLISGVAAYRILSEFLDVISVVIPELSEARLPSEEPFNCSNGNIRELSLLADASLFKSAMQSLRCDNEHLNFGVCVLENIDSRIETERDVHRLLARCGVDASRAVLQLAVILRGLPSELISVPERLAADGACYRISDLKISGNDLIEIGYRGREIGDALKELLCAVVEGRVENNRLELMRFVAK